jgi:glycosyltransferase involved in cell wall biosynthesis
MKISIVIPVYNEGLHLAPCLDAIAEQTKAPFEVIVVDNNSTDNTAAIAAQYDFVSVIQEPKQGVIHARTTGFNGARGDIIARIDADSLLPNDWVETVEAVMADTSIDAVSGAARYYNVAYAGLFNAIDLFFRKYLEKRLKNRVYLWGANMAIRKDAWLKARKLLCAHGGIHEDYDLAIHLQEVGGKVVFDERMQADVSSRRIDVGYLNFMRYVWVSPRTYAWHNISLRRHMYPVVAVCAIGYLPARVLHRGYDPVKNRFSFAQLFIAPTVLPPRVDPTVHVAN